MKRPENLEYKHYKQLDRTLEECKKYAHMWFEFTDEETALEMLTAFIIKEMKHES